MKKLTENGLTAMPGIRHGFFTRQGGVSGGIYASLNAGPGSKDDPLSVEENRGRIARHFGISPASLTTLHQVHGRSVITLNRRLSGERPEADAMVTNVTGLLLGILTADCVPVLFADAQARVVGAAHAGWKGALAGITDATLDAMEALGADRSRIHAAIGPAIGWKSYEVDQAFCDTVLTESEANSAFFREGARHGKYHFNLKGYVADRLAFAGVGRIAMLANDTYVEEDNFFSYRRTTHRGERDYGRQMSVIGLI